MLLRWCQVRRAARRVAYLRLSLGATGGAGGLSRGLAGLPRCPTTPPAHGGGGPATKATGLHRPPPKNKTQKESAKTRCRRCRSFCVLASSRREARGHRRHATAEAPRERLGDWTQARHNARGRKATPATPWQRLPRSLSFGHGHFPKAGGSKRN